MPRRNPLIAHHKLHPHHRYQLGVVFLFMAGVMLMFPFHLLVEEYALDMTVWQWYYVIPWMVFYTIYGLLLRRQITASERIQPQRRHILYWVLLGIALIAFHLRPLDLERPYAIDLVFALFTIFAADAYWDFRDIKNMNTYRGKYFYKAVLRP